MPGRAWKTLPKLRPCGGLSGRAGLASSVTANSARARLAKGPLWLTSLPWLPSFKPLLGRFKDVSIKRKLVTQETTGWIKSVIRAISSQKLWGSKIGYLPLHCHPWHLISPSKFSVSAGCKWQRAKAGRRELEPTSLLRWEYSCLPPKIAWWVK